jgi:excisionase family DNA binding protein
MGVATMEYEKNILTVPEAADFTRLSISTVYAYVSRRKLPHFKIGAKLLFRRADLEQWLNRHFVQPIERVPKN